MIKMIDGNLTHLLNRSTMRGIALPKSPAEALDITGHALYI